MKINDNFGYRVIRHGWRDDDDGSIKIHYTVEKYGKGLFGYAWRPCIHTVYGFGDVYNEILRFDTEESARTYIENMKKPMVEREILP